MKNIIKKIGKKTYIISGIIVILLITFISYGRYIYNDIRDFYFSSKSFYFIVSHFIVRRFLMPQVIRKNLEL